MNNQPKKPLYAAIVSMTHDHVIALNGQVQMPWRYKNDLKRFKRVTTRVSSTVIMGRVTWDSLNRNPLPGRRNVVVSRSNINEIQRSGVECYDSIKNALDACSEGAWVIGGWQIYHAAMQYLSLLDITFVPDEINDANALKFPEINAAEWENCRADKQLPGDKRLLRKRCHRIVDLP